MKKKTNAELENLNKAIWITRENIHAHHEAVRNLETKLTNQLSEFHRQAMAQTLNRQAAKPAKRKQ